MNNFCSNCGEKLDPSKNFCPNCGEKISSVYETEFQNKSDDEKDKNFLKKIFTSKGRLNRLKYFKYSIFLTIIFLIPILIILFYIGHFKPSESIIIPLFLLVCVLGIFVLVGRIMLCARRLHDLNFSGWWQLLIYFIALVVNALDKITSELEALHRDNLILDVVGLVLWLFIVVVELCIFLKRGTKGKNKYGDDPLEK